MVTELQVEKAACTDGGVRDIHPRHGEGPWTSRARARPRVGRRRSAGGSSPRQRVQAELVVVNGSEERVFELLRLEESGNKVLLLEDNGTIAMRAATSGKKVWLRSHPYNEKARHRNITAWTNFPEEINWSEL